MTTREEQLFTMTKDAHSIQGPTPILISREPIRLGQFLKLANVVQDGLEAKIRIANGDVLVNNLQETRRGRKLVHGDVIQIDDLLFLVTTTEK